MSPTPHQTCRYSMLILCFMLFYHITSAQYNFSATDKWLQENTPEMGGRSTLMIFKDGKIVYTKSINDLSRKQKFAGKIIARRTGKDPDEISGDFSEIKKIAIASCSKWLSAALVMTFIDEGKLKLSDKIGKFLPTLNKNDKANITIAQCLSHTTGIQSGNLNESRKTFEKAQTMEDAMLSIAELSMESKPGKSFHYSSVGLQIASAVIEKISGKDFRTLFKERIALPCEMADTDFGSGAIPIPAGSGNSTPSDYLRFLQMNLNNGNYQGKRVLKMETVALMQQNYAADKKVIYSPAEAGDWGYGLGEWTVGNILSSKCSEAVTSPGLFGSFPWVDNKHKYAAVLFTFYIKNTRRHERYTALKGIIDKTFAE